jgi:hypothetical protein
MDIHNLIVNDVAEYYSRKAARRATLRQSGLVVA